MTGEVPVAVIGGGYAGMAAAFELSQAGVPVTVYEAGPRLGGRARAIRHRGLTLDNGLHILIGAYRDLLDLVERAHEGRTERLLLRLPLAWRIGERVVLRAARLPAPLHLVAAFARARGIAWRDRIAAARFVSWERRRGFAAPPGATVAEVLASAGQSAALRRDLWDPLCLAALNTPPETASAEVFLRVLRDTLAATRHASDLLLPRCDLGTLFPEAAATQVERRGGRIRRGTRVTGLAARKTEVVVATASDCAAFGHAIVAATPRAAAATIAGVPPLASLAAQIAGLPELPITSIYLQYAGRVSLPAPMIGLDSQPGQWAFDRGRLCGQTGLVGVVISGPGDHERAPGEALAAAAHGQVAGLLRSRLAAPLWSKVVRERGATFACTPGLDRPDLATPHPRIWLAGDYTRGPYPATLEGAVRSGRAAAARVLASLDAVDRALR